MKVTVLVENSRLEERSDLRPEFGLSLYVETGAARILFDMGASGAFLHNAERLGVDLGSVETAVLSHHHFDHGGGLGRFLEVSQGARVYMRRTRPAARYFRTLAVIKRPIGLDLGMFERFEDRLEQIDAPHEIAPGVSLLTEIGSSHERPRGNRYLFVELGGKLVHDPFDHELMMVVREDDGMVVFSGCSHQGVLNMIDAAVEQFPGVPIKAVFGGFHLIGLPFYNSMSAGRGEVKRIARRILERVTGPVYTGHCTGEKAFAVLQGVMGERLRDFPTGAIAVV